MSADHLEMAGAANPVLTASPAHHDGSELYVPQTIPSIRNTVTVRVRVSDPQVRQVHLRFVQDGEPQWAVPLAGAELESGERWFSGELPIVGPVTNYRFLLTREAGSPLWLNGAGLWDRDVTDRHDFRVIAGDVGPDWAVDDVVYQVFPDRFARAEGSSPVAELVPEWGIAKQWDEPVSGTGPEVSREFFGGDLIGIAEHLDHLVDLGATTLYLTPIFPARSNHRYNASSFDTVDPLLGGDQALIDLVQAAHHRGLRVIGDITTNHTGDDHGWFRASSAASVDAPERGEYYFAGDGSYASWLGIPSLPKLNFAAAGVRDKLYAATDSVLQRWLLPPFELDGWRVDVANMTGRYETADHSREVAREIRTAVRAVAPDAVLVAEHGHDYTGDLDGLGWQATMNYAGFTRPIWNWLSARTDVQSQFLGVPGGIAVRDADAVMHTADDFGASVPWQVRLRSWNIVDSHDTARFTELTAGPEHTTVGLGLQFTLPGVPMIFAGAEIGLGGSNGEASRRPMPWNHPQTWDTERLDSYRRLIALRSSTPALRRGGLRWLPAGPDVLAFLRELPGERILVVAARATWDGAVLDPALGRAAQTLFGGTDLVDSAAGLAIPGAAPSFGVWSLT